MATLEEKHKLFLLGTLYEQSGVMDVKEKQVDRSHIFNVGTHHLVYPEDGSDPLESQRPIFLVEITVEPTSQLSVSPPSMLTEQEQEVMKSLIESFMESLLQQLAHLPIRHQKLSTYEHVLMDGDQTFHIRILKEAV
jgi:hypothetical protein